jgi:hypothetical protein
MRSGGRRRGVSLFTWLAVLIAVAFSTTVMMMAWTTMHKNNSTSSMDSQRLRMMWGKIINTTKSGVKRARIGVTSALNLSVRTWKEEEEEGNVVLAGNDVIFMPRSIKTGQHETAKAESSTGDHSDPSPGTKRKRKHGVPHSDQAKEQQQQSAEAIPLTLPGTTATPTSSIMLENVPNSSAKQPQGSISGSEQQDSETSSRPTSRPERGRNRHKHTSSNHSTSTPAPAGDVVAKGPEHQEKRADIPSGDSTNVEGVAHEGPSVRECPTYPSTTNCSAFMSIFAQASAARRKWQQLGAGHDQHTHTRIVNGSAYFGRAELEQSMADMVQSQCSILWSVNRSTSRSLLFGTRGQMSNVFIQYFYQRIVADSHALPLHERKNFTRLKKINMKFNKSEARATRSLRHFQYVTLFEQEDREELNINTNCGQFFQNFEYYRNERCFAQCLFAPGPSSISDNLLGETLRDVCFIMCICVCIYMYIYTYINLVLHVYMYKCVCVCVYVYMYVCVCICIYIHTYIHTHESLGHVCMYAYVYACAYIYIHTYNKFMQI